MIKKHIHILSSLNKILAVLLIIGVCLELIFFLDTSNLYGCLMSITSFIVFSFFLKEKYVKNYPFSFFMYLSMFMYRFLPLIATLAEGKPITFGFERPFETFIFESILFLSSSVAFYLACKSSDKNKNNILQEVLYRSNFFQITPQVIWLMGLFGTLIRLVNFSQGDVEYGDVGGKFLLGLDYLMYAPLCLFFPELLRLKFNNKKILWIYSSFIFILNIASNSRRQIIIPIGIIILLMFLFLVFKNLKITNYISSKKLILIGLVLFVIINLLSKISLAMLYTRKVRGDLDKAELFQETIDVINDDALLERLEKSKEKNTSNDRSYREGWTEYYVDNFMLARYANMRITDETLYYAEMIGYSNKKMQIDLQDRVLALFPTPILRIIGFHINKSDLEYSRGDFLYGRSYGSFLVTSHVADGLSTFGYVYFILQLLVNFLVFKLLNTFVYRKNGMLFYAPFALMNVFSFLGMFRNAQGIYGDFSYLIRGYLQGVLTYLIIFYVSKFLVSIVFPSKNNENYNIQ